jgi:hypothetical protein
MSQYEKEKQHPGWGKENWKNLKTLSRKRKGKKWQRKVLTKLLLFFRNTKYFVCYFLGRLLEL